MSNSGRAIASTVFAAAVMWLFAGPAGASDIRLVTDSSAAADPRFGATYRAACRVEIEENGQPFHRFTVHAPDGSGLAEAQRAGRFFAQLWRAANRRFGTLSAGLRRGPVDVWLTRTGEAGGEQIRSHVYVYDYTTSRSGLEWARELAHEYGHYLLPGATGYTSPESWSNGVLGERLFLRWLRDDVASGLVPPDDLPYVKRPDLDEFCDKQPSPLTNRIRDHGPDAPALARTDKAGMDAYTSLMLYVDAVYGPAALVDMLDFLPPNSAASARGPDFLAAFQAYVVDRAGGDLALEGGRTQSVFLPGGAVDLQWTGEARLTASVAGRPAAPGGHRLTIRRASPGWLFLTVGGASGPVRVTWRRAAG